MIWVTLAVTVPVDIKGADHTALWGAFIFAVATVVVAIVNGIMQRTSRKMSSGAHEAVQAKLGEIGAEVKDIKSEARTERADVREIRQELHAHVGGMAVRRAELINDVEVVVTKALAPWTRWAADQQQWAGVDRRQEKEESK